MQNWKSAGLNPEWSTTTDTLHTWPFSLGISPRWWLPSSQSIVCAKFVPVAHRIADRSALTLIVMRGEPAGFFEIKFMVIWFHFMISHFSAVFFLNTSFNWFMDYGWRWMKDRMHSAMSSLSDTDRPNESGLLLFGEACCHFRPNLNDWLFV